MASIPRLDRPLPEDLEGYTESRYDPDPDYSAYMRELPIWLNDYRRDEERKRDEQSQGRTPLIGHEPDDMYEQRHGYDESKFDLNEIKKTIQARPSH